MEALEIKNIRAYFMGVPVRCDEYNEQLNQTITMEKAEEIVEKIRSAFWEYKRVTGKPPEVINVAAEVIWGLQMAYGLERKEGQRMNGVEIIAEFTATTPMRVKESRWQKIEYLKDLKTGELYRMNEDYYLCVLCHGVNKEQTEKCPHCGRSMNTVEDWESICLDLGIFEGESE